MAVLLTPEQESKVHRLRSQSKALHGALKVIWDEKTELFSEQAKLRNEKSRWRERLITAGPSRGPAYTGSRAGLNVASVWS
jgi:hypothetical protein